MVQSINTNTFAVDIQLSDAELYFLLDVLKIPKLPGMPDKKAELSADDKNLDLLAGLNALRARDLIRDDHVAERLVVDKMLSAMLIVCASSQRAIFIGHTVGAEPQQITSYIYIQDSMAVVHRTERPGVERFIALFDLPTLQAQLRTELMLVSDDGDSISPIAVHIALFQAAITTFGEGHAADALQMLMTTGFPEQTAGMLLDALAQPRVNTTIMAIAPSANGGTHNNFNGLTLIHTSEGIWMIEPNNDTNMMSVQRTTRDLVYQRVEQFVEDVRFTI
jgi:hypothetical protein